MTRPGRIRSWLRDTRTLIGTLLGATVAAVPALESPFIAAGAWLGRRSYWLGTLYWTAETDLIMRLRRADRRFRPLSVAGATLQVDVTDASGRLHYFHGEPYEPEVAAALRNALGPGDVFLDVGANIGFFSVLAAQIVGPSGHVFAFEPHPEARAVLHAAVSANAAARIVEVVDSAVGAAAGSIDLFLSVDSLLSTTDPSRSPVRNDFEFDRSIRVPLLTLDGWLAEHRELAPRVAAIKIDVEGTERDVLAGMRQMRSECPHTAIVMETDRGSDADLALTREGYVRSTLDSRDGVFGNYLFTKPAAVTRGGP